ISGLVSRIAVLYPASPVARPAVPAGLPQALAKIIDIEHHRIDASRPQDLKPVFRSVQKRRSDALPSPARPDREPVQVIPPAIPARDDRSDQLAVVLGHNQGLRIAAE